jgi:hypothetical protein
LFSKKFHSMERSKVCSTAGFRRKVNVWDSNPELKFDRRGKFR